MGFYLMIGVAIIVLTICFIFVWRWSFIPPKQSSATISAKKRLQYTERELNPSDDEGYRVRQHMVSLFDRLPFIGLSDRKKNELTRLLDAVEWGPQSEVGPDDVYFQQMSFSLLYVLACLVGGILFRPLWVLILAVPLVYRYPVNRLKSIVKSDLTQIMFQFPDFYDVVYAQYSERNTNVLMTDIVESYSAVASSSFKKMLARFSIDLESGEDFALDMLARRYPNQPTINKFCSILRQRLKGDEASFVALFHFREALQMDVRDWMLNDLEGRKRLAARLTNIMVMAILSVVMIVYFYVMVKANI